MKKLIYLALFFTLPLTLTSQEVQEVTPAEAYQILQQKKGTAVYLIDVRSIAEYYFVGHPEGAYNIPLRFWDERTHKLIPNEDFIEDLKSRFKPNDLLLFICRSGGRSLKAARLALEASFTHVINIKEGFEGKKDEQGLRTVNGWKNRHLPYTYKIDPQLAYPKKQ